MSFVWACLQGWIFSGSMYNAIHVEASLSAHQQSWQGSLVIPTAQTSSIFALCSSLSSPCLGNHGNEKEILFRLKPESGLNHVDKVKMEVASCCVYGLWTTQLAGIWDIMKWLALGVCSYACVRCVKCLKSSFRTKWALLPKVLPISIDVHWHITKNVSGPCPWSSAVPIEELPLFLDELPAQCLARKVLESLC